MRKLVSLLIILLCGFTLIACASEKSKGPAGEESVVDPNIGKEPKEYYPFTGLEADGEMTNRAVAIMVNNQKKARPQTGLSKADVVFEMLAEGNITRFLAIYQSEQPDVVGPVRSAREYFFNLANAYDALYIYSGAANVVFEKLIASGVDYLSGDEYEGRGKLFVREPFRKAPHNLYVNFDEIYKTAEEKGFDITAKYEPFVFLQDGESLPENESYRDGSYVKIQYYSQEPVVEFEYDASNGNYTRLNDGETTIELESEEQIRVENVLIMETEHQVIDQESLRRAIDMTSGGKAYLLQQGKAQELEWENRAGRIVPVKDGEIVPFIPGKTWINVIQTNPPLKGIEQVQFDR